jgi:hypothetical protein
VATAFSEWSVELQEFHLVVCKVCTHLSHLPPIKVPLVNHLWVLPSHVERVVVEGAFHRSGLALGQMVSHFDKIDIVMIVEGFAAGHRDKELGAIEDQVRPHTRLLAERVDVKTLLTGP